jgi:hypothetical protein
MLRPRRKGLGDAIKALLVGVGLVLLGCWFWSWSVGQDCLDRIQVGKPYDQARCILEGRGFTGSVCRCHGMRTTLVFKRHNLEAPICLEVDDLTDRVIYKGRQSPGEWLLDFVTDPSQWWPRARLGRPGWCSSPVGTEPCNDNDVLALGPAAGVPREVLTVTRTPGRERPLALAVCLTLAAGALWLGVLQALILLAQQLAACELLGLALPWASGAVAPGARWVSMYWYVAVLGVVALAPVTGLVAYRLRSPLGTLAWALLVLAPPLALLEVAWTGSVVVGQAVAHQLRDRDLRPDEPLRWPLKVRETRRGEAGATGEVLVIEPGGEWRVTALDGGDVRRGKLGPARLAALADYLAAQRFLDVCVAGAGLPPVANGDSLCVEFGPYVCEGAGLSRRTLWTTEPPPEPGERESRARLVALVLAVDDLVREGGPP